MDSNHLDVERGVVMLQCYNNYHRKFNSFVSAVYVADHEKLLTHEKVILSHCILMVSWSWRMEAIILVTDNKQSSKILTLLRVANVYFG